MDWLRLFFFFYYIRTNASLNKKLKKKLEMKEKRRSTESTYIRWGKKIVGGRNKKKSARICSVIKWPLMYIVDHAKKRKSREWFIVYNIVWNMPSECYCCRVSEVSIDLSFEWIDPFGKNWNFILYCYETKEKNPWKLEHERKMEKVFLNQDRRVILLWINPNFCHGKKECEGFSGRILLAVGFVFFRRNSLDEKWCHERRLWAQRSPAILLGWWSVNGPCSCPPFVTWEFHYNLKRNRKNSD